MGKKLSDEERMGKLAADRAKATWGHAWELLSVEQRKGAVSTEVLSIVRGWMEPERITAAEVVKVAEAAYKFSLGAEW